jgi:hypothetical protein
MFWKKKGIDYNSPEFRAIDAGMRMIGQTADRYHSPNEKSLGHSCPSTGELLHGIYSTSTKLLLVDHVSPYHFRDIEMVLRQTVVLSYTGRKPNFDDFLKLKSGGTRYVDEDGTLVDGVQAGNEQRPTETRNVGPGLEGIPVGDCQFIQAVDPFTDPFVLFSGPSRTGFSTISSRDIDRGHCLPYHLSQFFCGGGSDTLTASSHDGAERHEPEYA